MTPPLYDATLSSHLTVLAAEFQAHAGQAAHTFNQGELRLLALELANLRDLAVSIERELAVHRMSEAGGQARAALEAEATETMTHLALDPEGKIVRADFGRKG